MSELPIEKVAIVTGGAFGLGPGISQRLERDGAKVAILDGDGEAAEAEASKLQAEGATAIGLTVDVSDRAAVEAALSEVRRRFGPPNVLVNNATMVAVRPFLQTTPEEWNRVIDLNLTATFHCCQVVLPGMIEAGWGRIVNISSSAAESGKALMADYVSSKAGMVGLTKSLALEFGPHGITVNAISPGFIDTAWTKGHVGAGGFGPGGMEDAIAETPVRRMGRPDDVANACAFLVSEEAGYVTGQNIVVNGGRST